MPEVSSARGRPSPVRGRTSSSPSPSRPYALTLGVMRLVTPLPTRTTPMPLVSLPHDALSTSSATTPPAPALPPDDLLRRTPVWEGEGTPCGAGSLTTLPSSFGSIYASETFRSFISVFNQSAESVHLVSVNVRVQAPSQRVVQLLDTTGAPRAVLESRAGINNIVKIALPELGVHKLFCTAGYKDPSSAVGGIRTLRQIYRFNVLPPLEPTLSVVPLYRGLEAFRFPQLPSEVSADVVHYMVDLKILNMVPVPVYITDATFVPQPPFRVRALLRNEGESAVALEKESNFVNEHVAIGPRRTSMSVGDTRNFLFHVHGPRVASSMDQITSTLASTTLADARSADPVASTLRRTDRPDSESMKPTLATPAEFGNVSSEPIRRQRHHDTTSVQREPRQLGHMTISWRSALGEVGHLDNVVTAVEPIIRQDDVEVSIYAVPEQIYTHRPFVARCAAKNNTDHSLRLYLQIRRDLVGEIVPVGVSGVSLGEVPPGRTSRCRITLIPLVRGQHSISGVRVVDIDSNMSYKADPPLLSVS